MYRKHLLSSFQKTKPTLSSGTVFAVGLEQVKKCKSELGMVKFVHCFLDGQGSFISNLVSFEPRTF